MQETGGPSPSRRYVLARHTHTSATSVVTKVRYRSILGNGVTPLLCLVKQGGRRKVSTGLIRSIQTLVSWRREVARSSVTPKRGTDVCLRSRVENFVVKTRKATTGLARAAWSTAVRVIYMVRKGRHLGVIFNRASGRRTHAFGRRVWEAVSWGVTAYTSLLGWGTRSPSSI